MISVAENVTSFALDHQRQWSRAGHLPVRPRHGSGRPGVEPGARWRHSPGKRRRGRRHSQEQQDASREGPAAAAGVRQDGPAGVPPRRIPPGTDQMLQQTGVAESKRFVDVKGF